MKSKYLYYIFFGLLNFLVISLAVSLPTVEFTNVEYLIGSVTFIFGIIYGFEITMAVNNFQALKSSMADFNGQLFTLVKLVERFGIEYSDELKKRVGKFLVKSIDIPLEKHDETLTEFVGIYNYFNEVEINSNIESEIQDLQYVYQSLYDMAQTRNQIIQYARKFVGLIEWILLIVLASILALSLFVLREGEIYSQVAIALLISAIVMALYFLYIIDKNKLQEEVLEYELFNRTLESIGLQKHFPKVNN